MARFIAVCLFTPVFLGLVAVGCTDLSPKVPKEQAQKILEAWLVTPSGFEGAAGFEKGQQQRVTVTEAYGYGYAPDESYAKLALSDFHYQVNGEAKTYTGKGVLNLRKQPDGQWKIARLAFESDSGAIGTEFKPAK